MSIIRKFIRYAVEDTPGTYQAPDTAIPHREGTLNVNTLAGDVVERNIELLSFDTLTSLRAAEHGQIQFEVGIAQTLTAGTPPPWAPLLLGSATAETALGEVTGTCTATLNAMSQTTLGSGASSVDGAYVGRIITIAFGTGDQSAIITSYNGTTKVAQFAPSMVSPQVGSDTPYTLAACTRYTPVSAGFGSLSFDYYELDEDSGSCTKWSFAGCQGEVTLTFNEKAEPILKLDMVGKIHAGPSSASAPALDYSDWGEPLVPNSVVSRLPRFHSYAAQIVRSLSFMTGAKATYVAKINDERVRIPARSPTATLEMDQVLSSAYNLDAAITGRATGQFLFLHGIDTAPIVLGAPAMQVAGKNPSASRQDGVYNVTANLAFRTAGAGDDSWFLHA